MSQNILLNFLKRSSYPILTGLFASLAALSSKHAFSDDIGGFAKYKIFQVLEKCKS